MLPDQKTDRILVAASIAILMVSVVLGGSYFLLFDDPEAPLGTTDEEITNMNILEETHKSYLTTSSYEVEYVYVETVPEDMEVDEDETRQSRTEIDYRYADDRAVSYQSNTQDGVLELNLEQYHLFDEGIQYVRDISDVETEYRKQEQAAEPFTGMLDATMIIGLSDTEFQGYTEDREGLVYEISASKEDDDLLNFDYEGVVTVDERGFVRSFNIEGFGDDVNTEYAMSVDNVGSTTVEEPDWLEEARQQTESLDEQSDEDTEDPEEPQIEG